MLKANNKDNRTTSLKPLLITLNYFTSYSRASIFDFEQVNKNVCGKSGAEQRHRSIAMIVGLFYLTC